jgi:hypothetical protein
MYQNNYPHQPSTVQNNGAAQLNYTEINQEHRHRPNLLYPSPIQWSRWPLRWLAFFCAGVVLANSLPLIDPTARSVVLSLTLFGMLCLSGWALWDKSQSVPAAIGILSAMLGAMISGLLLIQGVCGW